MKNKLLIRGIVVSFFIGLGGFSFHWFINSDFSTFDDFIVANDENSSAVKATAYANENFKLAEKLYDTLSSKFYTCQLSTDNKTDDKSCELISIVLGNETSSNNLKQTNSHNHTINTSEIKTGKYFKLRLKKGFYKWDNSKVLPNIKLLKLGQGSNDNNLQIINSFKVIGKLNQTSLIGKTDFYLVKAGEVSWNSDSSFANLKCMFENENTQIECDIYKFNDSSKKIPSELKIKDISKATQQSDIVENSFYIIKLNNLSVKKDFDTSRDYGKTITYKSSTKSNPEKAVKFKIISPLLGNFDSTTTTNSNALLYN